MKKIILLSISILVTLVGTILLGIYDFKVWLAPTGKNGPTITSEYRSYLVSEIIDFKNNESAVQNTKDKIELSRLLSNYKYSVEPIYHNENEIFTIDIYQNQFWHLNSDFEQEYDHYRYEIFIYDVNYELLKEKFKTQSLPSIETIDAADYPYFVFNFYATDEYKDEEAMMYPKKGSNGEELDSTSVIKLYDDTKLTALKFGETNAITLFDYSSTPTKNKNGDVFSVNYIQMYDYSSFVGDNDTLYYDNRDLFDNGAYLKIDAVMEVNDGDEVISYALKDGLLKDKVEDFTFDKTKISSIEFKDGFTTTSNTNDMIRSIKIEGVKTFNAWITGKYLWWHCLCAFLVLGAIMTGFYFIFSYEEKGKSKRKLKKKR